MAIIQNHLFKLLPSQDRKRLLDACETVTLTSSDVLCEPGQKLRHAYFPIDSYISLLTVVDDHAGVEVGMVGREGMLGASLAQGVLTVPLKALVQGDGAALRIPAAALRAQLAQSPALQRVMHRYLYVLMAQMATSAACLRYHQIGPRLARWLLMSEDRAHSKHLDMTQEFLAAMLGVRRVGVTQAASELHRAGLISYRRGALTVLDRAGLKAAACSCYAMDQKTYAATLGPSRKPMT